MQRARIVLFSLPLVTVAVVGFALFVVGAPRPYFGARVFGGPTEDASSIALRLSVVESYAEIERPRALGPLAVDALSANGRRAATSATADALGIAEAVLRSGDETMRGPIELTVSERGPKGIVLARGKLALSVADWNARARVRGGWLNGTKSGALGVGVAPGRGAFAVPFTDPLWVEVRKDAAPVVKAKVEIEPDGIELDAKPPFTTDASGRVAIPIRPREHATSIRVKATSEDGAEGSWSGIVPVVPGALHAVREGKELVVESPIERETAFFAIIDERTRRMGGPIALTPDGRGLARGSIELPELPNDRSWAVVSSDPALDSAAAVGWPLGPPELEPPTARAVPDRLLLDGLEIGRSIELSRRQKARQIALGFSALAAVFAGILLSREVRRSSKRLDRHLADAGADAGDAGAIAERPKLWVSVAVALLCIGMGFLIVALVAMYRIG